MREIEKILLDSQEKFFKALEQQKEILGDAWKVPTSKIGIRQKYPTIQNSMLNSDYKFNPNLEFYIK